MIGLIALFAVVWGIIQCYKRYLANQNRKYNQFSKPPLSKKEIAFVKKWSLDIPYALRNTVEQKLIPENVEEANQYDDYELRVTFSQEAGVINLVKSAMLITDLNKISYFEVEVLENKLKQDIYVGIVESRDPFINAPDSMDQINGVKT
jgi:hypothetical protein